MYVRKFEADSLDEALKAIKAELGPDAIILKTTTNKGLKGAFKKNRIEITAAISEKNYSKKAVVDHAIGNEARDKFYQAPSSYIANMIDQHDQHRSNQVAKTNPSTANSYGNMGLNRSVQTVKDLGNKIKNGLDDFLSGPMEMNEEEVLAPRTSQPAQQAHNRYVEAAKPVQMQEEPIARRERNEAEEANLETVNKQREKIDLLERKLYELTKNVERLDRKEPTGVYQLRTVLRSLDVCDIYIQEITKKALFELSEEDVRDEEAVFEFALREMLAEVKTAMPLFSRMTDESAPAITVLVSETSCGQTSMAHKLCALKENSVLIRSGEKNPGQETFSEKVFGIEVLHAQGIAEIVAHVRKSTEAGKTVFIDYRCNAGETSETKKLVEGLKRAFSNVEILVCLSAIHSEIYNLKMSKRYQPLADGIVVNHLDQCLNFGALFNLSFDCPKMPFKFYGTGDVIPDDLEAATGERIVAGIFQLDDA